MYNGSTISLKEILWKVFRHPLVNDLNYEDAAMYSSEAIKLLGIPLAYINKVETIQINNYKAGLPNNIINIKGIKHLGSNSQVTHSTDTFNEVENPEQPEYERNNIKEFTYTIENGVVKTSFENCKIQISYSTLPTDEDCFPLIPDNEKVKLGIYYYILHQHLEPLWLMGKITDKAFNYIEQKRHFYMGASQSSMQLRNLDHAQAMVNSINRLIINTTAHENFYKFMGQKEKIKKYN